MRVLTAAEMRAAEAAAVAAGTSYETLMENAGGAAAAAIEGLVFSGAGCFPAGCPPAGALTGDDFEGGNLRGAPGALPGDGFEDRPAPGAQSAAAALGAAGQDDAAAPAPAMVLLCGRGNNAGDAFVVARLLAARGWRCTVWLLCGRDFSPLARLNFERLPAGVTVVEGLEALTGAEVAGPVLETRVAHPRCCQEHCTVGDALGVPHRTMPGNFGPARAPAPTSTASAAATQWGTPLETLVLVDGVFGTGYRQSGGEALPPAVAGAFALANAAPGLRVALDVPSGLDCDSGEADPAAFRAGHTLTLGAAKPALLMEKAAPWVGRLHCLDIGL